MRRSCCRDPGHDALQIDPNLLGHDSQHLDALSAQPSVPCEIARGVAAEVVRGAVHFDAELGGIEVESST